MQQVLFFSFEIDNKLCIEVGEYLSNDSLHQVTEEVEFFVGSIAEDFLFDVSIEVENSYDVGQGH